MCHSMYVAQLCYTFISIQRFNIVLWKYAKVNGVLRELFIFAVTVRSKGNTMCLVHNNKADIFQ